MDALLTLLDTYDLSDPASGQDIGQFTNPDLQQLFDTLMAQGSQSLTDALKVGAAIEEIDILDLAKSIAATDNADIQQAYEHLKSGSENHLRAFTSALAQQTGETYTPQYLDQAAYEAILAGANTQGNGQGGRGQGGQGSDLDTRLNSRISHHHANRIDIPSLRLAFSIISPNRVLFLQLPRSAAITTTHHQEFPNDPNDHSQKKPQYGQ